MVLVVVLHISGWYLVGGFGETRLFDISLDLTPLRMPTFFLVSGLLAKSAIDNDWAKARRRSANLYFAYLLWTTVVSLRLFVPAAREAGDAAPTLKLLAANAIVPSFYWYIWALPVYYVIAAGLRRLLGRNAAWLLAPAALLSLCAHDINTALTPLYPRVLEVMWTTETMQNFLWFYLGIVAKEWIVCSFDTASRRALMPAFAAALAYVIALRLTPWHPHSVTPVGGWERLVQMIETPGYMVLAMSLFVMLRNTRVTRFFNWIGRGTLSVYLFHFFGIMTVTVLVMFLPEPELPPWLGWIAPLALAIAISAACRWIGIGIGKTPLRWTLTGPFPLSQWSIRRLPDDRTESGAARDRRPAAHAGRDSH
jgi:fucose 4-O-acetylase-like acetyltransferase